ncbi:uncharacterized protein [Venturia canescens]|nr:uncharacterized protein LOC122412016 isoform X2 [Venturia canescens]
MREAPKIEPETIPYSMTRHLVLEDDMKEYWGFYLLRGSSVTVSTCVRWPGASLTIIRGHKHLHECAFIGDDSSEELEELVQVARERVADGTSNDTATLLELLRLAKGDSAPSNVPERMKKAHENVRFHQNNSESRSSGSPRLANGNTEASGELEAAAMREILSSLFNKTSGMKKKQKDNPHHRYEGVFREISNIDKPPAASSDSVHPTVPRIRPATTTARPETSAEVFNDVLQKLYSLGKRGEEVLHKLVDEVDRRNSDARRLREMLGNVMNNASLSEREKKRLKRELVLGSPVHSDLAEDTDSAEDAALEKEDLFPDGIADDRGTVNETTLNDRSNSEFWSSFSSSEERLLECKGLVLNLPLNPHVRCTPKHEDEHSKASMANTVTYRVPTDGYYFFVFNSENEIQPNYVRIKFDLVKTMYDTSNPVDACQNTTEECSLPLNFFSGEKTVLELPVNGKESQWNEEYVVVSTCEPRTSLYLICIITVPVLILLFAFH